MYLHIEEISLFRKYYSYRLQSSYTTWSDEFNTDGLLNPNNWVMTSGNNNGWAIINLNIIPTDKKNVYVSNEF